VIFWRASFVMAHDRADRAGKEAAGYGAFAEWAHQARGEAVDARSLLAGTSTAPTRKLAPGAPPRTGKDYLSAR
jgi:hypothetical protein